MAGGGAIAPFALLVTPLLVFIGDVQRLCCNFMFLNFAQKITTEEQAYKDAIAAKRREMKEKREREEKERQERLK